MWQQPRGFTEDTIYKAIKIIIFKLQDLQRLSHISIIKKAPSAKIIKNIKVMLSHATSGPHAKTRKNSLRPELHTMTRERERERPKLKWSN